jgi:hypothetical protein
MPMTKLRIDARLPLRLRDALKGTEVVDTDVAILSLRRATLARLCLRMFSLFSRASWSSASVGRYMFAKPPMMDKNHYAVSPSPILHALIVICSNSASKSPILILNLGERGERGRKYHTSSRMIPALDKDNPRRRTIIQQPRHILVFCLRVFSLVDFPCERDVSRPADACRIASARIELRRRVWRGLGLGVSQRGAVARVPRRCIDEVAFRSIVSGRRVCFYIDM